MSPSTYECSLCRFTYGMTSMNKDWRNFLSSIDAEKIFLHRNEFQKLYPGHKAELPAIFTEKEDGIEVLVSAADIKACENLKGLIALVEQRVEAMHPDDRNKETLGSGTRPGAKSPPKIPSR